MGDTKVRSVTVEIDHPRGNATLVVRQPWSSEQRLYVAGDLPDGVSEDVLRRLGLQPPAPRVTETPPSSTRLGWPQIATSATPSSSSPTPDAEPAGLAELLDELVHAVLRAGRHQPTSTVDDLLRRAWSAAEGRAPLARALARLEEGLDPQAPPALAALTLAAIGELASTLRASSGSLWQELQGTRESLDPCMPIEVGRRRERGAVGWETRLLVEPSLGALFREEGPLGDRRLSRGSVGRCLSVILGSRRGGLLPARVEIQQYESEPAPTQQQLERIAATAATSLPELSENGLDLVLVPRPVWLAVRDLGIEQNVCRLSTGETDIVLQDTACPGATSVLLEYQGDGAEIRAVAGSLELRASDARTELVFAPWSALVRRGGIWQLLALGA